MEIFKTEKKQVSQFEPAESGIHLTLNDNEFNIKTMTNKFFEMFVAIKTDQFASGYISKKDAFVAIENYKTKKAEFLKLISDRSKKQ